MPKTARDLIMDAIRVRDIPMHRKDLRLSDIARSVDLEVSDVKRLLQDLRKQGYIQWHLFRGWIVWEND